MEFDTSLYYVNHLAIGDVSSYFRLDVRLCWQPTTALDMNIGVKNLLDDKHLKFSGTDEAN